MSDREKINYDYPDQLTKPINVIAIDSDIPDWEIGKHSHRQGQIMATISGLITISTDKGIWVIPPKTAIWIPPNHRHSATGIGVSSCYVVFIQDPIFDDKNCQLIHVNYFLDALLKRTSAISTQYPEGSADERLLRVLLDEIKQAHQQWLHLPLPEDKRLKKITDTLLNRPDYKATSKEWAQISCISERSLARFFKQETNLSLHNWRRRLHIILALQWLNDGKSVNVIANKLGYIDNSSFITMFKKVMKYPPKKFFAERMAEKR